jgi:hypothetical protein
MLLTPCTFLQSIYQPTYALHKIHSEANIKLLHVSASWCHHQGIIQNKGVQDQHSNLGTVSTLYGIRKF